MTKEMTREQMIELARRMAQGYRAVTGDSSNERLVDEFEATGVLPWEVKLDQLRRKLDQIPDEPDAESAGQ